MTNRERLLKLFKREKTDCVPVCPDISNMIPARLTGKPFWDIYLYQDPPLWKAYIDAVKYFNIDGGFELYDFGELFKEDDKKWQKKIVFRNRERIVTRELCEETGEWSVCATVHTKDNPPATGIKPGSIGLPLIPEIYEEIGNVKTSKVAIDQAGQRRRVCTVDRRPVREGYTS